MVQARAATSWPRGVAQFGGFLGSQLAHPPSTPVSTSSAQTAHSRSWGPPSLHEHEELSSPPWAPCLLPALLSEPLPRLLTGRAGAGVSCTAVTRWSGKSYIQSPELEAWGGGGREAD